MAHNSVTVETRQLFKHDWFRYLKARSFRNPAASFFTSFLCYIILKCAMQFSLFIQYWTENGIRLPNVTEIQMNCLLTGDRERILTFSVGNLPKTCCHALVTQLTVHLTSHKRVAVISTCSAFWWEDPGEAIMDSLWKSRLETLLAKTMLKCPGETRS